MSVGRRGFLRLLAAAPVAAPVVAREAAQKAGVFPIGSAGAIQAAQDMCVPSGPSSDKHWAETMIKRVFDPKWIAQRREWFTKRRTVGVLDPDLASSRSFSVSAAVRMQREREFERFLASEQEEARQSWFSAFGFEWKA